MEQRVEGSSQGRANFTACPHCQSDALISCASVKEAAAAHRLRTTAAARHVSEAQNLLDNEDLD